MASPERTGSWWQGSGARSVGAGQWCGCELWDDDARRDDASWGGLLGNIPHPGLFRRLYRVLSVLLQQLPPHVCVKALLAFPLCLLCASCTVACSCSLLRWSRQPNPTPTRSCRDGYTGLPGITATCGRQVRATAKRVRSTAMVLLPLLPSRQAGGELPLVWARRAARRWFVPIRMWWSCSQPQQAPDRGAPELARTFSL